MILVVCQHSMNYGCTGSSASVSTARDVLVNKFGYSNNASYVYEYSDVVVTQLDYGWPVIMRGEDGSTGGHAWVCDGYKRNVHIVIHNAGTQYEYETNIISDFYLRMNWGWDGLSDGWYLENDFTPSIYNFNTNKRMIINIHP